MKERNLHNKQELANIIIINFILSINKTKNREIFLLFLYHVQLLILKIS